jgi:uncharacterized membrane protein YdjX (TVP38/TMEM64 family)
MESENEQLPAKSGWPWATRIKLSVMAVIVLIAVIGAFTLDTKALLARATEYEQTFREHQLQRPALVFGMAFAMYVVVTGLSLPGAAVMTLVYAWLFHFWPAMVLVSFASTTGATVAFVISRYLLRDTIQDRFGERLEKFNQALAREGAFYLFTLRLIPAVPFFVINLVMGLTPLAVWTFWWVSQLGMLPGTAVFVWAGSSVPSLDELTLSGILKPQLIVAFVALGLFPLVVKKIMGAVRREAVKSAE